MIKGVIQSQTGAPVAGASIRVTNRESGVIREANASDQGQFEVPGLAPGGYDVEVSETGFAVQNRPWS